MPLTIGKAPTPTTKLVDEVFHSYSISGTGLIFAQGLSPFSMVCEGHVEMDKIRKVVKQAELAEAGSHLSLADASTLTATDVRFATNPQVAAEKLYGWSIYLDLFHGVVDPVAVNSRNHVIAVEPALQLLYSHNANSPARGMDLVNRALYETQQEHFSYIHALNSMPPGAARPSAPTHQHIRDMVLTFRAGRLSTMPLTWCSLMDAPKDP